MSGRRKASCKFYKEEHYGFCFNWESFFDIASSAASYNSVDSFDCQYFEKSATS